MTFSLVELILQERRPFIGPSLRLGATYATNPASFPGSWEGVFLVSHPIDLLNEAQCSGATNVNDRNTLTLR